MSSQRIVPSGYLRRERWRPAAAPTLPELFFTRQEPPLIFVIFTVAVLFLAMSFPLGLLRSDSLAEVACHHAESLGRMNPLLATDADRPVYSKVHETHGPLVLKMSTLSHVSPFVSNNRMNQPADQCRRIQLGGTALYGCRQKSHSPGSRRQSPWTIRPG